MKMKIFKIGTMTNFHAGFFVKATEGTMDKGKRAACRSGAAGCWPLSDTLGRGEWGEVLCCASSLSDVTKTYTLVLYRWTSMFLNTRNRNFERKYYHVRLKHDTHNSAAVCLHWFIFLSGNNWSIFLEISQLNQTQTFLSTDTRQNLFFLK